MSAILKNSTSITMYIPIALKLRIETAAQADERSVSQFLVRLLDKIVPPTAPAVQRDIEEMIAEAHVEPRAAARIRKIAKAATASPAKVAKQARRGK